MDFIPGLIAIVGLLFASFGAYAEGTVTTRTTYSGIWQDAAGQPYVKHDGYESREAACAVGGGLISSISVETHPNANPPRSGTPSVDSYGTCNVVNSYWGGIGGFEITVSYDSCPIGSSNAAAGGGLAPCTCAAGLSPVGAEPQQCKVPPPPSCVAKKVGEATLGPFGTRASAWLGWTNCESNCVQVYSPPTLVYEGAAGWYGATNQSQTGAACSGSGGFSALPGPSADPLPPGDAASAPPVPPPPATAASGSTPDNPKPTPNPNPCALGNGLMCPATIAGAQVCVACNSAASPVGNGTTAGAPGTTGTGGGGSPVALPKDGSSLSGTDCKDGLCTTTTFVRDSTGAVIGKNSDVQYVETYCAKNPGDPVCKTGAGNGGKPIGSGTSPSGAASGAGGKGGVGVGGTGEDSGNTFGGSCGSGFVCKGDAIQCAIAQDQLTRNCATLDDAPSTAAAVLAAGAGLRPSSHPANSGTSVSIGSGFDQTDLIAGACPADQLIQVSHFQPVVLPFSKMCDPARILGNILVGLTALTCLGIVFVRGK